MTDAVIGYKIEFDTGDVVQKQSTVAKGFSDMGAAAQQAASAFQTLQKSTVIDSSGLMAAMRGVAKDEERAAIAAKNLAAQWAQMGEAGAKAMRTIDFGNKMGEAAKASKKAEEERVAAAKKAAAEMEKIRQKELSDRIGGIKAFQAAQAKALAEEIAAAKRAADELRAAQWVNLGAMGNTQLQKNSATGFGAKINAYNSELAKKAAEEEAKAAKAAATVVKQANEDKGRSFDFVRLKLLAYAAVLWKSSKEILAFADQYKELAARLKLVSGSTEELRKSQEQLYRSAQSNRAPLDETVRLYYRMSIGMRDLGRTQAETIRMTDLVAKAMKITGASTTETAAGLQQFSQAMQAGVLNGDEFRSVMENMPRVAKALTDYLHVSIGQLREMSAQGKITSQVLANAVLAAGVSIEAEFKTIPLTVNGSFQQIKNAFEKFIGDVDKASGASTELAKALKSVADTVDDVDKAFKEWMNIGPEAKINDLKKEMFALNEEIIRLQNGGNIFDKIFGSPADLAQKQEALANMEARLKGLQTEASGTGGDTFFDKISEVNKTFTDNLAKQTEAGKGIVDYASKAAKRHSDIIQKIISESIRQGFDPALALSVAFQESQFNPNATGIDNGKGRGRAKGVFQMLDSTAAQMGVSNPSVNSYNPDMNIVAGIKYLVKNLAEFKGDKVLAVAAHNAGPDNIHKYGDQVPPPSFAKGETYNYVQGVTRGNRRNPGYSYWADMIGGGSLGEADKVQKHFDSLHNHQMDQLKARQAAYGEASRTNVIRAEQEVKQIENTMDEFSGRATIEMKVAIDQKSYQEQIDLIAQQQAKSEQLIRQRAEAATGTDDSVRKAREELKALDEEIASLKRNKGDQAKIDSLEIDRVTAVKRVKNEELKAQGANLTLQKELAENSRKYDQMREEAGKRVIEMQKQQEDQAQRLGATSANAAKEIIASQLDQVKAQVAINAAQRETELTNRQDLSTIEKQREALKGRLEDSITVIEAEKNAAIQKAAIDMTILQQEEAMLQARRATTQILKEQHQIESQLAENSLKQAAARKAAMDAQVDAARAIAKAQVDAQDTNRDIGTKQVKESQLEMNAFWDQYMSRLRDYADLWTEITGNTEDGWSKMVVAMGEYSKQFDQIHQQFTDLQGQPTDIAKSWGDMAPLVEGLQQGQAAAAALAKTMLAMRNNYKEGSSGYEAMTIAAENLMQVTKLLAVVEGVMGVLHQLSSGDPYTAPFRAAVASAIVAVQLASIGMSSAKVGGMSAGQAVGASQTGGSAQQGGGVFGDTSAKSTSIDNSLKLIAQNSSTDLDYSAGMLRALESIDAAMQGVSNTVIRTVNPKATPAALQSLGTMVSGSDINKYFMTALMGPIGYMMGTFTQKIDPLGKALMDFTFSVKKSITAYGLMAMGQTLSSVLKDGFKAIQYTTVTTTSKLFGMTMSKSDKNYYAEATSEVNKQFTLVIKGISDSLKIAAEDAFGIGADEFIKKVGKVKLDFGQLDLTGLKGDEFNTKLKEMFSGMADNMARALMPDLAPLQKAGEGMYETLIRVASGLMTAKGMLSQLGIEAIKYTEIAKKQGDVAAEVIRQSLQNLEGIDSNMGELLSSMSGTAQEIMQTYLSLVDIRAAATYAGLAFEQLNKDMIIAAGGAAKFAETLRTYLKNFKGDGTLYAVDVMKLQEAFGRLGVAMPKTKEEFVNLVESQDKTTKAGRLLYVQLLNLSGAFAAVADQAKSIEDAYKQYGTRDPLSSYKDQLDKVEKDFGDYINMQMVTLAGQTKTLQNLPTYLTNVEAYGATKTNLLKSRSEKAGIIDKIDGLDEDIAYLEKKKKKTKEEKAKLAELRADRKAAGKELDGVNSDIKDYENSLRKLDKAIKKAYDNFDMEELAVLEEEKAKLLQEQGAAYLKSLSDVFDQITQSVKAAQDTLRSIQDDILTLGGQITGGLQGRVEVATARSNVAELAYKSYTGTDINVITDLASKYKAAIMEEYQAKLDMINDQKSAIEKERDAAQKKHDEEIAALEKQLGVAKELYDAVKNIQQYVKNLKLSSNSTLSPERKLAEAQARYQELLAKAKTGDVKAMQDITSASDAYLEIAKQYYGSTSNYTAIFDAITNQLGELSNYNVEDAQTIQDKIDKLNADHEVYLKGIEQRLADLHIEEQIKQLSTDTIAKLQELESSFAPAVDRASEDAKAQMETLIGYIVDQNVLNKDQLDTLREMAKAWGITLPDNMGNGTTPPEPTPVPAPPEAPAAPDESQYTAKQKIQFRQDREKLQGKIDRANEKIARLEKDGKVTGQEEKRIKALKKDIETWQTKLSTIPAFARGGFARPGYAIVGEDGPEIVNFARPAQVYNASQTRDIMSAQSDTKTFAALEAIKVEVAALVKGQMAANPEIINELRSISSRVEDLERTQKLRKV